MPWLLQIKSSFSSPHSLHTEHSMVSLVLCISNRLCLFFLFVYEDLLEGRDLGYSTLLCCVLGTSREGRIQETFAAQMGKGRSQFSGGTLESTQAWEWGLKLKYWDGGSLTLKVLSCQTSSIFTTETLPPLFSALSNSFLGFLGQGSKWNCPPPPRVRKSPICHYSSDQRPAVVINEGDPGTQGNLILFSSRLCFLGNTYFFMKKRKRKRSSQDHVKANA